MPVPTRRKRWPKFFHPRAPRPALIEEPEETEARSFLQAKQEFAAALYNLNLLFNYFGLKKSSDPALDYIFLAIYLAREFVPGFHSPPVRGRPKKDPLKLAYLLLDAELIKRSRRRSKLPNTDRQVVETLVSKLPYSRRWGNYNKKTLQNLLTAARDPKQAPFPWLLQKGANLE